MTRYLFDPVGFAREQLGWEPDPAQAFILQSPKPRVQLNWGRQSGKTTLASVKIAHTAVTMPGTTSVWVSAHKDHTADLFARLQNYFAQMDLRPAKQPYRQMALILPNRSRILGLAAVDRTVRSHTAHLIVIDEAAQVKDSVHGALSPLLARYDGVLWMVGTPQGKLGRFWEIWSQGDDAEWLKSKRTTAECGRISAKFLESERKAMGEDLAKREYECEFLEDGLSLLRADDVYKLFQERRQKEE